jgi:hypothetical protein
VALAPLPVFEVTSQMKSPFLSNSEPAKEEQLAPADDSAKEQSDPKTTEVLITRSNFTETQMPDNPLSLSRPQPAAEKAVTAPPKLDAR